MARQASGGTGLRATYPLFQETLMPDDTTNRGSADRARININENHEVTYWTKALGVSAEELRKAVEAVGPMADAVRKHLGK